MSRWSSKTSGYENSSVELIKIKMGKSGNEVKKLISTNSTPTINYPSLLPPAPVDCVVTI